MQRRLFIKNTALSAVAISAFGFVRLEDDHYVGDCETTSDILGPFYRPGSPVRNDLLVAGDNGHAVQLSGTIKHNDCVTPYANAKIELWHCDPKGVYDNASQEFRYRPRLSPMAKAATPLKPFYRYHMKLEMESAGRHTFT